MNSVRLIIFVLAVFQVISVDASENSGAKVSTGSASAEIQALLSETRPEKQEKLVKNLVARVGPEAAQEELLHSGLPFTGETHLVIHTVGGATYKKFGTEGILRCRPYFLGACYHGFLIEAIGEQGEKAVIDTWSQCRKAGAAVQYTCAHAVGHGLMAVGHSILPALTKCDSLGTKLEGFPPRSCYGGVFMENIWKVHHGHLSHQIHAPRDPSYPCDDPRIQPKYQPACWENQTPILTNAFRGDLAKIAEKCDSLADSANKDSCFDGLARQIHTMSSGDSEEAFRLCSATHLRQTSCLIINAQAAFAIGDQDQFPCEICSRLDTDSDRARCYGTLSSLIPIYGSRTGELSDQVCTNVVHSASPNPPLTRRHVKATSFSTAPASTANQDPQYTYGAPPPYSYPNPYTYPNPYKYEVPYPDPPPKSPPPG